MIQTNQIILDSFHTTASFRLRVVSDSCNPKGEKILKNTIKHLKQDHYKWIEFNQTAYFIIGLVEANFKGKTKARDHYQLQYNVFMVKCCLRGEADTYKNKNKMVFYKT